LQTSYIIYYKTIGINFIVFLDSGTNGFCFVSITKIISLIKSLDIYVLYFPQKILIKGFDSRGYNSIIYYFVTYYILDRHQIYNILFLILDLNS
jgi:hypothetical protein